MFSVRHGRNEIGLVPDETLTARPAGLGGGGAHALVLAGRSWAVLEVDWKRRVVQAEPTDAPGVARWRGSGQPLGSVVARGVRVVLTGVDPPGVRLSDRASHRLGEVRAMHAWAQPERTMLVVEGVARATWWTFAGWRANLWLAQAAAPLRREVAAIDDLTVALDAGTTVSNLRATLEAAGSPQAIDLAPWIAAEALDGLKLADCLPHHLALEVVTRRVEDTFSVALALAEPIAGWHGA